MIGGEGKPQEGGGRGEIGEMRMTGHD